MDKNQTPEIDEDLYGRWIIPGEYSVTKAGRVFDHKPPPRELTRFQPLEGLFDDYAVFLERKDDGSFEEIINLVKTAFGDWKERLNFKK